MPASAWNNEIEQEVSGNTWNEQVTGWSGVPPTCMNLNLYDCVCGRPPRPPPPLVKLNVGKTLEQLCGGLSSILFEPQALYSVAGDIPFRTQQPSTVAEVRRAVHGSCCFVYGEATFHTEMHASLPQHFRRIPNH